VVRALAHGGGLALHQRDLAIVARHYRFHAGHAAARMIAEIDAPFAGEYVDIERGRRALVGDQFRHVEADAARPHDRHLAADRCRARDHIDVAHALG
jgi:hypothetical protein